MLYVVHADYGCFYVPEEVAEVLGCEEYPDYEQAQEIRTSPLFAQWVREHSDEDFAVVDIPADATDWELFDYDGCESIIAVVGGRLVHLRHED